MRLAYYTLLLAGLVAALIVYHVLPNSSQIVFLNVIGDSSLIQFDNANVLIDAAPGSMARLSSYIKRGSGIDMVFITHCDKDHYADLENIYHMYNPAFVYANKQCANFLNQELHIPALTTKAGDFLQFKNGHILVLWPNDNAAFDSKNKYALVLLANLSDKNYLFLSDVGKQVEKLIVHKVSLPAIDLVKIGHHGSKTSTSEEMVSKLLPRVAVITKSNPKHRLPNQQTLDILANYKVKILLLKDYKNDVIIDTPYWESFSSAAQAGQAP